MTPEGGTPEVGYFEQWMEALDEMDRALPAQAQPACPNCGRRELRPENSTGVPTALGRSPAGGMGPSA
jgi:hypothetical protein